MKKIVQSVLVCLTVMLLITSCQSNDILLKREKSALPRKVQTFIDRCESQNGIHMYTDGQNGQYLFLNSHNVIQGGKASYFTDVKTEIVGNELLIHIEEQQTSDYTEPMNNKMV